MRSPWVGLLLVASVCVILGWCARCKRLVSARALKIYPKTQPKIPRVVHFVYGLWDDFDSLPRAFRRNMEDWHRQGFDVKLWNKERCEDLLHSRPEYGRIVDMYQSFKRNVQKADLIRYCIVYDQGGFYMDLDALPGDDSLFAHSASASKNAVFFVERIVGSAFARRQADVHPIREGLPEIEERIANYAFGCVPRHVSLLLVMNEVERRVKKFPMPTGDPDYYVIFTTGPSAVTRALQQVRHREDVHIFERPESRSLVRHKCTGTWRQAGDGGV